MTAVAITVQTPIGPYPQTVGANSLDIAFAASSLAGNYFPSTGRELLLVRNTDIAAKTFTVTAEADAAGRKVDITSYSVGAGETAAFWVGQTVGWADSSGNVNLLTEDVDLYLAVLRIQ